MRSMIGIVLAAVVLLAVNCAFVVNEGQTERVHLVIDAEVNDWLWEFFPKPTLVDRAGFLAQRTYLPVFWKMRRMQTVAKQKAWQSWDGSAPQQFWRTLRGQRG
jgi:hypothetical protein